MNKESVDDLVEYVGAGWRPFVRPALEAIVAAGGDIVQVKEKFGGLRIYVHDGDRDKIDAIVEAAEKQADRTCEKCGKPGKIVNLKGWLKNACEDHDTVEKWRAE